MSRFPALKDAQERLERIFDEAGSEMDLGKVKSVEGTNVEKAAEIKRLNDEIRRMQGVAKAAAAGHGESGAEPGSGPDASGSSSAWSGTGDSALARFADLLKTRTAGRVELKAATTTNSGARTAVASGTAGPAYLHQAAGIDRQGSETLNIEAPYFAAFTAQSETAEEGTKPSMADPTLQSRSMAAYAVTKDVSDQTIRFGAGLTVIGQRMESEVVYSINAATASAFETEGGTPIAFTDSASHMLDVGIAEVESQSGNFPTLIVLNPADYPMISAKEGADSGTDIGSRVSEFNGVRLAANPSITAGVAAVVDGAGWSAFGTAMMLDTLPNLSTNIVTARAEQYFTIVPHYSGSAVAVDITSA